MKTKYTLHAIAVFLLTGTIQSAYANTGGLVFPPADDSHIYQYPPQAPQTSRQTQRPIYTFGQPDRPILPPQAMMPQQRMPMQGYSNRYMPRRSIPRPPSNNRQSSPFGNNMNMPFANNGSFPFKNMNPFNDGGNSFNPFSGRNNPFSGNSFFPTNPMDSMFGERSSNSRFPFFKESKKNRKKAWGDERNIWPDFYTDFTDDAWDTAMGGPRDLGRMPGGWRFPYISTPDPVTVTDAVTNQFPPIAEEAGNMLDISEWGVFDQ